MSSANLKRIKQINQRNSNPFNSQNPFDTIPLGVDGLLVDMMSNLDLQEDLKLGSNHYVEIKQKEQDFDFLITQYYFSESRVIEDSQTGDLVVRTIAQMQAAEAVTHKLVIKFSSFLKFLSFNGENAIVGPQHSQDAEYLLTQSEEQTTNKMTKINMQLYQKKRNNFSLQDYYQNIHNKAILILEDEYGNYTIDEQVDSEMFEYEEGE